MNNECFIENSLENSLECSICFNNIVDITKLSCEHSYCKNCILNWIQQNKDTFPNCRRKIEFIINNEKKKTILQFKDEKSSCDFYIIQCSNMMYSSMLILLIYIIIYCSTNFSDNNYLNNTNN